MQRAATPRICTPLLVYNARIYTMDPLVPTADALVVCGERVAAVGAEGVLRQSLGHGADELNLRGATVVPGLIDGHIHFVQYSLGLDDLDIYELPTKQETLRRVSERVQMVQPGEWVQGSGWNWNLWQEGAIPHCSDLDHISHDVPVALSSKDLHSLWVNSRAM